LTAEAPRAQPAKINRSRMRRALAKAQGAPAAIGGIVLDLGTQANLISNQTRVYRLIPEARNRINTVFMVTYFVGGALGTFLAGFAWSRWQWNGICALGASFLAAALIISARPDVLE